MAKNPTSNKFDEFEESEFEEMPSMEGSKSEEHHEEMEPNNDYHDIHENHDNHDNHEEHDFSQPEENIQVDRTLKTKTSSTMGNKSLVSKLILPVGGLVIVGFAGLVVVKPLVMNYLHKDSGMNAPMENMKPTAMLPTSNHMPLPPTKVTMNNGMVTSENNVPMPINNNLPNMAPNNPMPVPSSLGNNIEQMNKPTNQIATSLPHSGLEVNNQTSELFGKINDEISSIQASVQTVNTNVSNLQSQETSDFANLNQKFDALNKKVDDLNSNQNKMVLDSQNSSQKIDSALISAIAKKTGVNSEDVQKSIVISGYHLVGVSANAADISDESNNITLVNLGQQAPGGGTALKIVKDPVAGWELITTAGTIKE